MSVRRRRVAAAEDGSLTLWMLGLCVAVLMLGGISVDLWRAFVARRDLANVVDGAAVAGASVIDEGVYRTAGGVRLRPDAAAAVACGYLTAHTDPPVSCHGIAVTPDAVEITASRTVELTLLRVLTPDRPPLTVRVTAEVVPRAGG